MMNDKLVLGVVLIPSSELFSYSINFNKKSFSLGSSGIKLGIKDYIPHITLAFGLVFEKDVKKIVSEIEKIADSTKQINVFATKVSGYESITNDRAYIDIKRTDELYDLHKKVVKSISKYFSKKVSSKNFYKFDETGISKTSINWAENFLKKSSRKNYEPHISLKCKKIKFSGMPKKSISSTIAIYHMGEGCTCRKLIKKIKLKKYLLV